MVDYFVSSTSGALLRRDRGPDDVYRDGGWYPTQTIGEYMVGKDDNVDDVTEAQARASHPAAFATSTVVADGEPPPRRLPNGDLEILARLDGPNGEIGDAVMVIGPEHELYPIWDAYLSQSEEPSAL